MPGGLARQKYYALLPVRATSEITNSERPLRPLGRHKLLREAGPRAIPTVSRVTADQGKLSPGQLASKRPAVRHRAQPHPPHLPPDALALRPASARPGAL